MRTDDLLEDNSPQVSRRQVLAALGAASTAGVAGCSGGGCEEASTVTLGFEDEAEVTVANKNYEHPSDIDGCPLNGERTFGMSYTQREGSSGSSGSKRGLSVNIGGGYTYFDFEKFKEDVPMSADISTCIGFKVTSWTENELEADLYLVTYNENSDRSDENPPSEWKPISAEVCYSRSGFL